MRSKNISEEFPIRHSVHSERTGKRSAGSSGRVSSNSSKVEYSLTERGKSLIPILDGMCEWGDKNRLKEED